MKKIIELEGPKLVLTKNELMNIYKLNLELLFECEKNNVTIERPKMSVFNVILSYFDLADKQVRIGEDNMGTNFDDIVEVMLDDNAEDYKISNCIKRIKREWNIENIVSLCIMKNRFSLIRLILDKNNLHFNPIYAKIGIEFDSFDIVYLLKSMYPESYTQCEKSYLPSLLLSFQRSNTFWLAKLSMLKSLIDHTNYIKAESFLLYTLRGLEKADVTQNPMYYAPNLLLFSCNLIEICRILVNKYGFLGAYTEKIEEILLKSTAKFIEDIEDEFQIRALVFEKDYENRDSLDLLSKYNIVQIMNNKNMEKIALELWTSQYDVKGTILSTSSIMKIIEYDSFNKPRDILSDFIFFNWKFRKTDNFDHHLYQFQVWKTSMKAKFITEGLFLLILTVIFQYYLMEATQAATTVDGTFSSYSAETDATTQETLLASFETQATIYYADSQITVYLGWISLTFPIRIVLIMAFAKKSKRRFQFLTVSNLLDLLIFCVFSIRLYFEYNYFISGVGQTPSEPEGVTYYDNVFKDSSYSDDLDYLYSVGSACLWIRIILLYRLTRFLGPLVKMIQNMIGEMSIFMVLFVTQLVVFACVGNLLFSDTTSYETFYEACKTLFDAALANYDFDDFSDSSKSEYLGIAYLVIFIVLNNILLLNLLIAILSSTYAQLEDTKLVLYINEILKLRSSMEYDKRCSALVSTFPPWNVIALLFSPFIMFSKNSEMINLILFHIEYLPIILLLLITYIVINILILPLAYIKGLYVNLQQIWSNRDEGAFLYRLFRLVVWLFFGLIILLLNLVAD